MKEKYRRSILSEQDISEYLISLPYGYLFRKYPHMNLSATTLNCGCSFYMGNKKFLAIRWVQRTAERAFITEYRSCKFEKDGGFLPIVRRAATLDDVGQSITYLFNRAMKNGYHPRVYSDSIAASQQKSINSII